MFWTYRYGDGTTATENFGIIPQKFELGNGSAFEFSHLSDVHVYMHSYICTQNMCPTEKSVKFVGFDIVDK